MMFNTTKKSILTINEMEKDKILTKNTINNETKTIILKIIRNKNQRTKIELDVPKSNFDVVIPTEGK